MNNDDTIHNNVVGLAKLAVEESGLICSIQTDEISDRETLINDIKAQVLDIQHDPQNEIIQLRFDYDSQIAHSLLEFSMEEQGCCGFLQFSIQFNKTKNTIAYDISSDEMKFDDLLSMVEPIFSQ